MISGSSGKKEKCENCNAKSILSNCSTCGVFLCPNHTKNTGKIGTAFCDKCWQKTVQSVKNRPPPGDRTMSNVGKESIVVGS